MEIDLILESLPEDLQCLGFPGHCNNIFPKAFQDGDPSSAFIDIIYWLSSQICSISNLQNHITPVKDELLDLKALPFFLEMSSLLQDLCCPIKSLTKGPVDKRLLLVDDKVAVVVFLVRELQASRIIAHKRPPKNCVKTTSLQETKAAKELKALLISLKFGKPPADITFHRIFSELGKKLRIISESHDQTPKIMVGQLLFSGCLTEKHWFQLNNLYKEMYEEYKNRRILLCTRLDVTIQSFIWADRLKNKSGEIINKYNKQKSEMSTDPSVKISDVLSATTDLAVVEKTSSAAVRKNTKSSVNRHIIGAVPDRGGRPEEQQPPPPEVPSWQKNDASSRGGMRQSSLQSSSTCNFNDRNTSKNRNENTDTSAFNNNQQRNNFTERRNYSSGRGGHSATSYQPVQYNPQLGNQQFGFGGYMTAGDNFSQYGMADGVNQFQPRPNRGSEPRPMGNYMMGGDNFQHYARSDVNNQFQSRPNRGFDSRQRGGNGRNFRPRRGQPRY